MPVATRLQAHGMRKAIRTLFERMEAIIPDPLLTHEEVTALWAAKEHHELLRTAAEVAYVSAIERGMEIVTPFEFGDVAKPSVVIKMTDSLGRSPPLVPRLPCWQPGASPSAEAKLHAWLERRIELGRQFGLVQHLFDHMMRTFTSGAQVRYVWPSVLLLARNAPVTGNDPEYIHKTIGYGELCDNWAKKNAEFKAVPHPKLSLAFRQALQETSAVLTAASMLTDDHVREAERVPREVTVSLSNNDTFTLDGLTVYRM